MGVKSFVRWMLFFFPFGMKLTWNESLTLCMRVSINFVFDVKKSKKKRGIRKFYFEE